jgi:dTDP-4-dehydrorhamnose 3,5-epimerase
VSAAGVIRGTHFSQVPPGQAKYVTCLAGTVLDVVVDLRVGSPAFGSWESVLLDDVARRAVYIGEGLGHAFMSLSDGGTIAYLCSTPHVPDREHAIHPFDPQIGIAWPTADRDGRPVEPILSERDGAAPSLAEAAERGLLPDTATVRAYQDSLSG